MSIFFIADPHFDHDAIRIHCNRPFDDVNEMNESLVDNWNSVVKPQDTVYVIGDFAWKRHAYWQNALKGKIFLIKGNHDKMSEATLNQFAGVKDLHVVNDNHQMIMLCHYRLHTWPSKLRGSWHLYGHSHGRLKEDPKDLCFSVGVDVWDYTPVSMGIVTAKFRDMESRQVPLTEKEIEEIHAKCLRNVNDNEVANLKYRKEFVAS